MLNVLLTGLVSFALTFLVIPVILRVAREKKLYDIPDERKLHTKAIASLGGVGMFIGFLLSTLVTVPVGATAEFPYFVASAFVIFFLGLKDDILIISASKKFLGQLTATAILVHLGHVRIDSMHGFLGIGELPVAAAYVITYATIIVIINAFNLIDGVDGLAGSLGVLSTAIFGVYFLFAGLPFYSLLAFAMTGSLLGFLYYNFHPAKIFMGDSGSLLVGMVNAILVIRFITVADSVTGKFPLTSSVAIGFSILLLPLLDTLRVFSIRIAKGRSPFSPDRNHIHHLLLDQGLNHRQVTLTLVGLNAVLCAAVFLGRSLGSTVLISVMLGVTYSIVAVLFYKRRAMKVTASTFNTMPKERNTAPAPKMVAIKAEPVAVSE